MIPKFEIFLEDEDFYSGKITNVKTVALVEYESYAIEIVKTLNKFEEEDAPLRTYKYKANEN
jgi:hypothetical protein